MRLPRVAILPRAACLAHGEACATCGYLHCGVAAEASAAHLIDNIAAGRPAYARAIAIFSHYASASRNTAARPSAAVAIAPRVLHRQTYAKSSLFLRPPRAPRICACVRRANSLACGRCTQGGEKASLPPRGRRGSAPQAPAGCCACLVPALLAAPASNEDWFMAFGREHHAV